MVWCGFAYLIGGKCHVPGSLFNPRLLTPLKSNMARRSLTLSQFPGLRSSGSPDATAGLAVSQTPITPVSEGSIATPPANGARDHLNSEHSATSTSFTFRGHANGALAAHQIGVQFDVDDFLREFPSRTLHHRNRLLLISGLKNPNRSQ